MRSATPPPSSRPRRSFRRPPAGFLALAAALAATLGIPRAARAGAWTLPDGHYYARVSVAGINSMSRFDESGRRVALSATGSVPLDAVYESRELRAYFEYGLFDRLTLYGSTAYKSLAMDEHRVRRETSGLGDVYLGGRFRLVGGRIPASVAGEVTVPPGYSTQNSPALGAGEADVTFRGLVGASWGRLYATADGGFRLRGGDYRNEIGGSLEAGGHLPGMLGGRCVLRFERSVGASRPAPPGSSFDPVLESPRRLTIDGGLSLEIQPGLELEGTISHVLNGRNALAGNTLEIALVGFGPISPQR
jgi:hypothetical protein